MEIENQLLGNVGKCVLVVDDDEAWSSVVSCVLNERGVDVITALNGEEAISKFSEGTFDLVVSDFKMQGMDGVDTLKAIREIKPDVKTILVTCDISEPKIWHAMGQENIICVAKELFLRMLFQ